MEEHLDKFAYEMGEDTLIPCKSTHPDVTITLNRSATLTIDQIPKVNYTLLFAINTKSNQIKPICLSGGIAARLVIRSVCPLVPATVERITAQERDAGRLWKLPMYR